MKKKLVYKNVRLFITAKRKTKKTIEFLWILWSFKKHGFQWEDGFTSYEVALSSDEKLLIKKFKHNYDRKVLSDELLRIIRYHRELQRRQVNYTNTIPSLYRHFKKSTLLNGENLDVNYGEIMKSNAYVKETDLTKKLSILLKTITPGYLLNIKIYNIYKKRLKTWCKRPWFYENLCFKLLP